MDELTAIKGFRAERDAEPPEAREAIWRTLEARIEAAAELAAPAEARTGLARGGLLTRRRRLLLTCGTVVAAALVAGALVISSGPTTQPASAAEILHQTADAAAASDAPASMVPGPGEFFYRSEQRLEIQGWRYPKPPLSAGVPDGMLGGTLTGPHAYNALVPTMNSQWIDEEGGGRMRQVTGTPRFWSATEEEHWKAAGSPLPGTGEEISDTETPGYGKSFNFPDTSKLPTEAVALRRAIEAGDVEHPGFNPIAHGPLDASQTKEELLNLLVEGEPSPQLQAAIFNALAELPGISVRSGVTDALGREGDSITTSTTEGVGAEYLFDPSAGSLLAFRATVVEPSTRPGLEGIPTGTTVSERDFVESAVVTSTHETGPEGN